MQPTPEHITVRLKTKAEISGGGRNEPSSAERTSHQKPRGPDDVVCLAVGGDRRQLWARNPAPSGDTRREQRGEQDGLQNKEDGSRSPADYSKRSSRD